MYKESFKKLKLGLVSLSTFGLLAACGNTNDQMPDTETPPADTTEETTKAPADTNMDADNQGAEDETQTPANTETNGMAGILAMDFQVSLEEAVQTFHQTFGENINLKEIEFDENNGKYYYEIEGWDDQNEYELKVDADTGEIRQQSKEASDDSHEDILELEKYITPEEAINVAVKAADSDYVEEWTLEFENGKPVYEIDLKDANDVDVDAVTGEVL